MDKLLQQPKLAAHFFAHYLDHASLLALCATDQKTRARALFEITARQRAVESICVDFPGPGYVQDRQQLMEGLSGTQLRALKSAGSPYSASAVESFDGATDEDTLGGLAVAAKLRPAEFSRYLRFYQGILEKHLPIQVGSLRACDMWAQRWLEAHSKACENLAAPQDSLLAHADALFQRVFAPRLAQQRQQEEEVQILGII